jgi:hypothetical protein
VLYTNNTIRNDSEEVVYKVVDIRRNHPYVNDPNHLMSPRRKDEIVIMASRLTISSNTFAKSRVVH